MIKRTSIILLAMTVLAGSLFLQSCDDDDTAAQNSIEQEQRFFDIYREANYPEAVLQPSGIYFLQNSEGDGIMAGDTSWLLINHVAYVIPDDQVYETYLENVAVDNRILDTLALYGTYKIQNGVINEGFTAGMKMMREGGEATFMFTSDLGFGAKNSRVGSYRSLKYEVELLEVINDIVAYEAEKMMAYTDTIEEVQMAYDSIDNVFMYYVIDDTTSGAPVAIDSTIQVAYKGYLTDGRVFDESADEAYYEFKVGDYTAETTPIVGWHLGLENFKEGEKGRLIIPYQLAYGDYGKYTTKGNVSIPPYETLVFDVEVISVDPDDDDDKPETEE